MAREVKKVELRTVDDSPVLEVPVVRLESEETGTRTSPVRLKITTEDSKDNPRLNIPDRADYESRTHQPGIEVLIEQELPNPDAFESDWGSSSTLQRQIPWGWFVLIGLLLSGAALWSLSQVQESESHAKKMQTEAATMLDTETKENQEASELLDRIESQIRRFFKSSLVAERARIVRQPERVTPLMEAYYTREPAVAQPLIHIRRLAPLTLGTNTNFWIAMVELDHSTTQNLVIDVTTSGEPLIDWETLVCYQPMEWDHFVRERPTNTSFDFRVYVEADNFYSHEFADSKKWSSFRLTALGGEDPAFGYAKVDGPIAREIFEQLNKNQGGQCSLILRISIPQGLQSRSGVVIEKLVNSSWLYIDLPDSGS